MRVCDYFSDFTLSLWWITCWTLLYELVLIYGSRDITVIVNKRLFIAITHRRAMAN